MQKQVLNKELEMAEREIDRLKALSIPKTDLVIDGRVAVTVEFAHENPEQHYWAYSKDADDLGLDPWRYIDCDLDRNISTGDYELFGNRVLSWSVVYMQV